MKTNVYHIPCVQGHEAEIEGAAQVIREGGLVAIPTETVYGLGADALNEKDVAAKTHYENKYFSIDVPEDWIGYWDVIEEENSLYVDQILYRLSYKPPVENYGGGTEIYILDISDTSVPLSVYRASIPDYAEESRGCIIH